MRIIWRNFQNYSISNFNTLVACLPNESKEILHEKGIEISKSQTFNYLLFCKFLPITQVYSSQNLNNNMRIVAQKIFKIFMNQIEFTVYWVLLSRSSGKSAYKLLIAIIFGETAIRRNGRFEEIDSMKCTFGETNFRRNILSVKWPRWNRFRRKWASTKSPNTGPNYNTWSY